MTRPTAIVVGTGPGGATAAKALQGAFDVTMLEAGAPFTPLRRSVRSLERVRATGLLFDARETRLVFPHLRILPTDGPASRLRGRRRRDIDDLHRERLAHGRRPARDRHRSQ